jgi:hypothetical protein
LAEVNNALALAIKPPEFDLSTPLLTASRLRQADNQDALTQLTIKDRGDRQNALADYATRSKAGDPKATEALISHPEIYSQVVQIRNSLEEGDRKRMEDNLQKNAKGAQRVMSITDPAERAAAWKEELDTAFNEKRIDPNTYQRLSKTPPNDLVLQNVMRTALSMEQAITLEQKEKDRTAGTNALAKVAAAYGGDDPQNGNGNVDAPAITAPRPGGPVASTPKVWGDTEAEKAGLYPPKIGAIDKTRPIVNNPDGSFSTEKTITVGMDGKFLNIPTIVNGQQLTNEQAIAAYRGGTNKAVGEYGSQAEAEAAAVARSAEIGRVRGPQAAAAIPVKAAGADDEDPSDGPSPALSPTAGPSAPVAAASRGAPKTTGVGDKSRIPLLIAAAGAPGLPAETRAVNLELLKNELAKSTGPMNEYGLVVAQDLEAGRTPPSFEAYQLRQKEAGRSQVNIDQRAEGAFWNEFGKKQADRWNNYITEGDKAHRELVDIRNMREISARVGSQGAAADWKETLGPYAEAVGVDLKNLSDIQAFSSIIERLAPQQRAPGSGSTSDIEYKGFKKSLPTLIQNPDAREITLDTMEALKLETVKRAEIATQLANKEITRSEAEKQMRTLPDPMDKFKEWKKQNPELYKQAIKAGNEAAVATPAAQPAAKNMSKADIDESLANARAAIAKNPAARETVIKRLKDAGLTVDGL